MWSAELEPDVSYSEQNIANKLGLLPSGYTYLRIYCVWNSARHISKHFKLTKIVHFLTMWKIQIFWPIEWNKRCIILFKRSCVIDPLIPGTFKWLQSAIAWGLNIIFYFTSQVCLSNKHDWDWADRGLKMREGKSTFRSSYSLRMLYVSVLYADKKDLERSNELPKRVSEK